MLFASGGASRALAGFPGTGLSFGAWRVFLGGLGLIAFILWRGGKRNLILLSKQPIMWLMGASVLFYQSSFFIGAARIGIAVGTLVALGSAPLLAGLLAWRIGLGKPTKYWAASTLIAILGLVLLTSTGGKVDLLGFALVLLAGTSYSIMTTFGVRLVRDLGVSGGEVLACAFGIGGIFALPIMVQAGPWILEPKAFAAIVWAGIAAASLAYALFGIGISHLSAGTVSTLTLFEPVTATTIGVLLLDETITTRGWLGCLVIMAALALLGYSETKKAK